MPASSPTTLRKVMIWLAPVLIVVLAVVLIVVAQRGDDGAAPADEPTDPAGYAARYAEHRAQDMARRDADDPLAIGPVDAPVVMVVYSDYQCGYCALWVDQTQQTIVDDYVESGQVRIEWRDVNIFGPPSKQAAKAAYAAALQGKFRTFHDALFAGGKPRSETQLSAEALVELAQDLALDAEQFEIDMRSEETAAAVQLNEEEGTGIGAFSTPSFMINGIPIAGAQPAEIFHAIIDNELADAN